MQFSEMFTSKTREIWEKVEVKDRQKRIKEREINEIKKREKLIKLKRERDRQKNNNKKRSYTCWYDIDDTGCLLDPQPVFSPADYCPEISI